MPALPFCLVLMPFHENPNSPDNGVDFDVLFERLIAPGICDAGMLPFRAKGQRLDGRINKQMFEQLILSEYAVVDISAGGGDFFYGLGLRYALRQSSTVIIYAGNKLQLPLDVEPQHTLPYHLDSKGSATGAVGYQRALTEKLLEASKGVAKSPLFQLVEDFPDIQRLKTDVFRDRLSYSDELKTKLASARRSGEGAVRKVEHDLGTIAAVESGSVIDLFLSYRAVKSWQGMIDLTVKMSPPLAATVMVQEQLALALNRLGRSNESEVILLDILRKHGPSSETYGILGRVYKDRWAAAKKTSSILAEDILRRAVDAYLKGFEADWRDAYPGINAVTLMELCNPPDSRREKLLPVVVYAVEQRIATGKSDYWDRATRLELAILSKDESCSRDALRDVLAAVREPWELETTSNNLRLIRQKRESGGELLPWVESIEEALSHSAQLMMKNNP